MINQTKLDFILHKCVDRIEENRSIRKRLSKQYEYDFDRKKMYVNNKEVHIGKKALLLLELLIRNNHRIVLYHEIKMYIWNDHYVSDSALRSLVKYIRQKISKNLIQNLSGVGYKIICDDPIV